MAGERPTQKAQIEIALLKQNMTAIEHTVISQNAAVRAELSDMNRVLKEIHDKLDKTILEQAVQLTEQKYKILANKEEIKDVKAEVAKVNGKIAKAGATITALIVAVVGGLFQWYTPGSGGK